MLKIKVVSKKNQYILEKTKINTEQQKLHEIPFDNLDQFVEQTNIQVLMKIIIKILWYIIKKI